MKLIPESWWDDFIPKLLIALTIGFLSATLVSIAVLEAIRTPGYMPGFQFFLWWLCLVIPITLLTYVTSWKQQKSEAPMPSTRNIFKLGVWRWNLIFRPIVSIVAGIVVACALWLIATLTVWFIGKQLNLSFTFWVGVAAVVALFVGFVEEATEPEKVPPTEYLALITWLGMPTRFYRRTGTYGWTGSIVGLGRSDRAVIRHDGEKVVEVFTDANGFIIAGQIPFKVWHSSDSTQPHREVIMFPTKNESQMQATLTLTIRVVNPRLMLDSADPALYIGDNARQELRETAQKFVDTDIPAVQEVFGEVLQGAIMLTCFLPKTDGGYKAGAVVRDEGGNVMYKMTTAEQADADTADFKQYVIDNIHHALRQQIVKTDDVGNTTVRVSTVAVTKPITEVINDLGYELLRVTIGDIKLPQKVTDAADQASAEVKEREAQMASAKTIKQAQEELLPSEEALKHPGWREAMGIAAAQDSKNKAVQVIFVSGGESEARSAVLTGSIVGSNLEKGGNS